MNLFKSKEQPHPSSAPVQIPNPPLIQSIAQQEGGATARHTLISVEMEVKGVFTGRGDLQVDGTLEGNINIEGAVTVSDGAHVTGDISADTVTVAGQVKGNIASKKLEITATGKVWGDLQVERLLQHEGGFHSGHSQMHLPGNVTESSTEAVSDFENN